MKQFTIQIDHLDDIQLIGIASDEKAHKICWKLNHHFNFHFKFYNNHLENGVQHKGFLVYKSNLGEDSNCFLIQNNNGTELLDKQLSIFNFFLLYTGSDQPFFHQLFEQINSLKTIKIARIIAPETIKDSSKFYIE